MSLFMYTSNRMEHLADALAGIVRTPLASPLAPEVIVVQSKGMQRWVAMELARRLGVWANCSYPFPDKMMGQLIDSLCPDFAGCSFFAADVMTWGIMDLLPPLSAGEEFAPIRHYLRNDRDGLKLLQLAGKLADTLDRYSIYRPDLLLRWERRGEGGWQGALWRELSARGQFKHRARLREEFIRAVGERRTPSVPIPGRISVFGVSYLPPFHLDLLAAAAQLTDVHLFLLSPTREYWGDIGGGRSAAAGPGGDENYLLSSLGRLGREFSEMVIDLEGAGDHTELYEEPDAETLLHAVQRAILNLDDASTGAWPILPGDRSIQIHSCHSPMREIEVLHDNLLHLLETVPGLQPRDIVVMTPRIDAYAPYISAIFGGNRDADRSIPYSIADRTLAAEGKIASVVLKIVALVQGRFTVPEVLDILTADPVRRKFDLDEPEVERIHLWLEKTRVRWGMDEADRQRRGLPPFRENTWVSGLERLLLGYALPEREGLLFNGKLPYDDMEGASPVTLGKLLSFVSTLHQICERLASAHTPGEWRPLLLSILEEFVAGEEEEAQERAAVAAIFDSLAEMERSAGFSRAVQLPVVRAWLEGRLAKEEKGYGFMTGGVTFCAMLPMRSIPFRVVALVGMNDGVFPRQNSFPAFDLTAKQPRRGDRSPRDEDRYLFLESLLSARDCFYISYVGQSMKDNSEIPPSVVVSDLTDFLSRRAPSGASEVLVTTHRLQPFSSVYFTPGSGFLSYSRENCAALAVRRTTSWTPAEFLASPLPPPPDEWKDVALPVLLRFFRNPARYFLEHRLGIRLMDDAAGFEEREPFAVGGLDGYGLKQQLVERGLAGCSLDDHYAVACCQGILPPARHGELLYARVAREVSEFLRAVEAKQMGEQKLEPLQFEYCINGYRLAGRIDRLWTRGLIRYRCAKTKANDLIAGWIEHVILNAVAEEGCPRRTTIVMSDGWTTFSPVDNAGEILSVILDLYWQGLMAPLRFFPETSWAYARDGKWSVDRARGKWVTGYDDRKGEGDEPHFRLCFGATDPFTPEFDSVARRFFAPLLEHLDAGKDGVS